MKSAGILRYSAVCIVALSLIAGFGACGSRNGGGEGGAAGKSGAAGTPDALETKSVRAAASVKKTLKPYIDENGDVVASVNVAVYPDIGGRLVGLAVALGDSVSKGQTVARIDPSKPGADYAISPVVSPITGTVTAVDTETGETVTTSTSIVKVGIISDLEIDVYLPEKDSAKAQRGMSATVSFEALPGESFWATVSRVSPVLNSTNRTRKITLVLNSPDRRISAGMYAKVRLFTAQVSGKVVIPDNAILSQDSGQYVFVLESANGKTVARKRDIVTGISVDSETAVESGLAEGEQVVYEGTSGLADGSEVTVLKEKEK